MLVCAIVCVQLYSSHSKHHKGYFLLKSRKSNKIYTFCFQLYNIHVQCSVRREGTGHYFSFQPFSRPLSMLSTHNTYQNDPQGIPINVIIMISHHVTVKFIFGIPCSCTIRRNSLPSPRGKCSGKSAPSLPKCPFAAAILLNDDV